MPKFLIAEIMVRMVIWIDRGAIAKDTIAIKYNWDLCCWRTSSLGQCSTVVSRIIACANLLCARAKTTSNDANAILWSRYVSHKIHSCLDKVTFIHRFFGRPKKDRYHIRTCLAVLMCVKIRSRWKINRRISQLCFHYKKEIVYHQIDTIHLAVPSTAQRTG